MTGKDLGIGRCVHPKMGGNGLVSYASISVKSPYKESMKGESQYVTPKGLSNVSFPGLRIWNPNPLQPADLANLEEFETSIRTSPCPPKKIGKTGGSAGGRAGGRTACMSYERLQKEL